MAKNKEEDKHVTLKNYRERKYIIIGLIPTAIFLFFVFYQFVGFYAQEYRIRKEENERLNISDEELARQMEFARNLQKYEKKKNAEKTFAKKRENLIWTVV